MTDLNSPPPIKDPDLLLLLPLAALADKEMGNDYNMQTLRRIDERLAGAGPIRPLLIDAETGQKYFACEIVSPAGNYYMTVPLSATPAPQNEMKKRGERTAGMSELLKCPPSLAARLAHDRFPKNPRGRYVCIFSSNEMQWLKEAALSRDLGETMADHRRLVRELDVLLCGEDGAAKQASLCDIVSMVAEWKKQGKLFAALQDGPGDCPVCENKGKLECGWTRCPECTPPDAAKLEEAINNFAWVRPEDDQRDDIMVEGWEIRFLLEAARAHLRDRRG